MNKRFLFLLFSLLLIVSNLLMVCLTCFALFFFLVECLVQDADPSHSPEHHLVEVFGEDKREIIKESLRKYEEDTKPLLGGERIEVNSLTTVSYFVIQGLLCIVSFVLGICLLLLLCYAHKKNSRSQATCPGGTIVCAI